jgi:hypothetical protein
MIACYGDGEAQVALVSRPRLASDMKGASAFIFSSLNLLFVAATEKLIPLILDREFLRSKTEAQVTNIELFLCFQAPAFHRLFKFA